MLAPDPAADPTPVFRQGEGPIELEGAVEDSYDEPADLDVVWILDEQDPLAASVSSAGAVTGSLDPDALELGEHSLTLRATDSDDVVAVASTVFIVLGPLGAPDVIITAQHEQHLQSGGIDHLPG